MDDYRIMRIKEVIAACGLSRSSIYAFIITGSFPKPVSLGSRAVGWRSSDVQGWIVSRTAVGQAA